MNKYSKIKLTSKSRSIDFADLQSFPLDPANPIKPPHINSKTQEPSPLKPKSPPPNLQENDEKPDTTLNTTPSGVAKLSRNRSVSAAKQTNLALQTAVQRAFSMRRSSSVSERYCRIHDQSLAISSPLFDSQVEEDEEEEMDHNNNTKQTRSDKKKKKKTYSSGRILKACKRLLGI